MLRLENNQFPYKFKLFIWLLMSFQAGYINVGGFLIFGNFVSHVTGTSSQIGMGVADLNWLQALTFITILFSFILGSAFSGNFIGRRELQGKEPQYVLVTGFKAFLFFLVLIVAEFYFTNSIFELKLLLVLILSLICGIQNATCSQATNGFLKPTHMTGLSTDIGINLFKVKGHNKQSSEYSEEKKKNNIRIGILGSFISGGAIAFFIFSKNGHYGFIFPFISSLCMLVTSLISERYPLELNTKKWKFAQVSILSVFLSTLIFSFRNILT